MKVNICDVWNCDLCGHDDGERDSMRRLVTNFEWLQFLSAHMTPPVTGHRSEVVCTLFACRLRHGGAQSTTDVIGGISVQRVVVVERRSVVLFCYLVRSM